MGVSNAQKNVPFAACISSRCVMWVWVCDPPPSGKLKETREMRENSGVCYWLWLPGDGEGCISIVWSGMADSAGPETIDTQTRIRMRALFLSPSQTTASQSFWYVPYVGGVLLSPVGPNPVGPDGRAARESQESVELSHS